MVIREVPYYLVFKASPVGFTSMGLNLNLSPLGLNTVPFSALEKTQKHCMCNFLFLLNISEIYRIPSVHTLFLLLHMGL